MLGNKDIDWSGIIDFKLFKEKSKVFNCFEVDFDSARKLYKNNTYLDNATEAWETARWNVINSSNKSILDEVYNKAKMIATEAFNSSVIAKKISKNLGVDDDIFVADLPCIGAAIERLAFQNWETKFFNKALNVYNSGYWICAYADNKFIVCGDFHI